MRPLLRLYAAATTLAAPALRLMLARRVRRGKEIAARLPERSGLDPTPRPPGRLLWLHAASVGESVSVLPLLQALTAAADGTPPTEEQSTPALGAARPVLPPLTVLMTTGTVTSAALLDRRLPELGLADRVLHRFVPLDVPAWAARFLDHWQPDAAAFVESEIWPNLIAACRRRGIPMMLVNARLSARSFARWRYAPRLAAALFGAFARVQAQSDGDAHRLRALGARRVVSPGNLKFAAPPLPADPAELARLHALLGRRPVWLAASTHPGEEVLLRRVHEALAPAHPGLLTILVPRHPERGAAIAAVLAGLPVARRGLGQDPPAEAGIWIGDTLGELGLFYRLAPTVFMGKSLVQAGGQNPLEAARLGCAVATGPHAANFADAIAILRAAGALAELPDADALTAWVDALLRDPARRAAMGEAGAAASARHAHLPAELAALLQDLLHGEG